MNEFKFSYDEEQDDLFVYLPDKKSYGGIEIGDFILDFDKENNLVSMQVMNASETLSKLISKIISLQKVKGFKMKVINFRSMSALHLEVDLGTRKEVATIIIPVLRARSPVLQY